MTENIENSNKKKFNIKKEVCWMLFDIAIAITSIVYEPSGLNMDGDTILGVAIVGIFFGLVVIYLPAFIIYRLVIKHIISAIKKGIEQNNLRKLHTERIQAINGISNYIKQYFISKDYDQIRQNFVISKSVSLPNGTDFLVDTTNKMFLFYNYQFIEFYKPIEKMLIEGDLQIEHLKNTRNRTIRKWKNLSNK